MAYYGNYGGVQAQLPTQLGGQVPYQGDCSQPNPSYGYNPGFNQPSGLFSSQAPIGLAGYGGGWRAAQPGYYTGPSYSTTSDNDVITSGGIGYGAPMAGYGAPMAGGYSLPSQIGGYGNIGSYGVQSYAAPPNFATPSYVSQPAYAMPNYSSDPYCGYPPPQQIQQLAPQPQSYTQHASGTISQVQQAPQCGDDLGQLAPQIEAAYEQATGQRRQPVIKRQVITIPGTPGRVQQVVRRLPTPTPDIVERVFIVKPQRDVVNLVIERPGTPPAQYKDRTILGKQRRPVIQPRIVRVAARSQYQQFQQYQPLAQYQLPVGTPQYQNYVQALPPPSPLLNVQTIRTAPTGYSYPPQQPALSCQQQYQPELSQGHLSQAHLSQAQLSQPQLSQPSQSQIQQQLSQHQLAQPQFQQSQPQQQIVSMQPQIQKQSYIVAPVQYDDSSYAAGPAGYNGLANYGQPMQQPGLQQLQSVQLQQPQMQLAGPPQGGPQYGTIGYGSGTLGYGGGYSTGFGGGYYGGPGNTPQPPIGAGPGFQRY